MRSNTLRLGNCLRRRRASFKSENRPSDVAVLGMPVNSRSLFDRSGPRPLSRSDKKTMDSVLRGLISRANRELASLLRDVRTESHGTLLHDTRISKLLMRAVRCAAKQYRLQTELGSLALTDDLTGLYNRRGFMALAERQLKLGRRFGREMLLFVMDVDHLKHINDSFGHSEGDLALRRTAEALEQTFRDSDVVARLGGDEFAVLAIEASGHSEATINTRLFKRLKSTGARESRYQISLSTGLARFNSGSAASLEELMATADRAMYEHKRQRSLRSRQGGEN